MKTLLKLTIALIMGIVAIGFQSCGNKADNSNGTNDDTEATSEQIAWKYIALEDEFGDDNGEKVLSAVFDGTFSNTATDGSEAKMQILYSDGIPIFRVFNYGNRTVKGDYFMRFKVKDAQGEINILYLLNKDGFFVPTDVSGTLGMRGIDSLLNLEQPLKFSGVLLDGDNDLTCLVTEIGYLGEATGDTPDYSAKTEANQPKYQFYVNPYGLKEALKNK